MERIALRYLNDSCVGAVEHIINNNMTDDKSAEYRSIAKGYLASLKEPVTEFLTIFMDVMRLYMDVITI